MKNKTFTDSVEETKKYQLLLEITEVHSKNKIRKIIDSVDYNPYNILEARQKAMRYINNLNVSNLYDNLDVVITKQTVNVICDHETILGSKRTDIYVICKNGVALPSDVNISFIDALKIIEKLKTEDENAEPRLRNLPVYSYFQQNIFSKHTYVL